MLKHTDLNPNQANNKQDTPLDFAAHKGYLPIVKFLMSYAKNPFKQAIRALNYAKKGNHTTTIAYLTRFTEADIKQRIKRLKQHAKEEQLPRLACRQGDFPLLRYVVEVLKIPLKPDENGNTLLHHLASNDDNLPILHYLLTHTNLHTRTKNKALKTPRMIAQGANLPRIAACFNVFSRLQSKNRQVKVIRHQPCFCLHLAAQQGDFLAVKYLVDEVGLRPYKKNRQHHSPFEVACRHGLLDTVKYFVEEVGMRPMPMNGWLTHAVKEACTAGHLHICHYLIENVGAKPTQYCCCYEACQQRHQQDTPALLHNIRQKKHGITRYKTPPSYGRASIVRHLLEVQPKLALSRRQHILGLFIGPNTFSHWIGWAVGKPQSAWHQWVKKALPVAFFNGLQAQNITRYLNGPSYKRKTQPPLRLPIQLSKYGMSHWSKKEVATWSKRHKKNACQNLLSERLAVVKRTVELHEGFSPHDVQLLAVITLYLSKEKNINTFHLKGRLAQIMTGQGKSITIAMLAILHGLEGRTIDIITSSTELSKREAQTKASLFSLFNLTVAENSREEVQDTKRLYTLLELLEKTAIEKAKNPYKNDIVYGTPLNFGGDILHEKREKRPFDVVIVDESDNISVDGRNTLTRNATSTPGMEHLQLPFATVWKLVTHIHDHIITRENGKHYYITTEFEQKGDEIILQNIDTKQKPEAFMVPIEGDKYAYIKAVALDQLKELFRTISPKEKNTLKALNKLEDDIERQKGILQRLSGETPYPKKRIQGEIQRLEKLKSENKAKQTAYQKQYPAFVELPLHLCQYIQEQLPNWVERAIYAYCYYEKDLQYTIVKGRIVPIDYSNTGELQHNMVWGQGLSQFLCIKENLEVHPETLTSDLVSNVGLLLRYKTIYGLTGTLGNRPSKNFLRESYHVDCISIPPHVKRTIAGNSNPDLSCKVLTPYLCHTKSSYAAAVGTSIAQHVLMGRSLLIICRYIAEVHELTKMVDELRNLLPIKSVTTYTGETTFTKKRIDVGELVIATNIAGRGFDLSITPDLEEKGGLHVMVGFNPENERIWRQLVGRAGRNGSRGTAQLIIYAPGSTLDMAQIMRNRNSQEEKRMQRAAEEVAHMRFKDRLFENFCETLDELFPNRKPLQKLMQRQMLENIWAKARQKMKQAFLSFLPSQFQVLFQIASHLGFKDNQQCKLFEDAWATYAEKHLPDLFKKFCQTIPESIQEKLHVDVWQDFMCRNPTDEGLPKWEEPSRNSLKEQFALWLCSVEPQLAEHKYDAVRRRFQDFIKKIKRNAKAGNVVQNPCYYVQEGNFHAQWEHYTSAKKYYQRAIDQDPMLALHAYYNKAYVLFQQKKTEEAKDALEQAKKILNWYYKPRLLTFHYLVTEKGSKKTISDQVQRQLNILLLVEQYIDNALATIKYAKTNQKKIAVNTHEHIEEILYKQVHKEKKAPIATGEDLDKFTIDGLTHLFTLKEINPPSVKTAMRIAMFSLCEIMTGSTLMAYGGFSATGIGRFILQEGIDDVMHMVKSIHNSQFEWKDWGLHKGIRLAVEIVSIPIDKYRNAQHKKKTNQNMKGYVSPSERRLDLNVAKEHLRHDLKLKDLKKPIPEDTKEHLEMTRNVLSHYLKTSLVRDCMNTVVDDKIEKILQHNLEHIIAKSIESRLKKHLKNIPALEKGIEVDRALQHNMWQDKVLNEGMNLLSHDWSDIFVNQVRKHISGKASPQHKKDPWAKGLNYLYTFLRGLGVRHLDIDGQVLGRFKGMLLKLGVKAENIDSGKAIQLLEAMIGTADLLTTTHRFTFRLNKSIEEKFTKEIEQQHNVVQPHLQSQRQHHLTRQQKSSHTPTGLRPQVIQQQTHHQPYKNAPYTPRSNLENPNVKKEQPDKTEDEAPFVLQENRYDPSSIDVLTLKLSHALAKKITQQIHQKLVKPVTSHFVNQKVNDLVKTSEQKLKQALFKLQQKNRGNYGALVLKIKKSTSKEAHATVQRLLNKGTKNKVEYRVRALANGAPAGLMELAALSQKWDLSIEIQDEEGNVARRVGDGKQQLKMVYTSPKTNEEYGHWDLLGKNYTSTGKMNCLFDAVAAAIDQQATPDELRKYCCHQLVANQKALEPTMDDYYALCINNPKAVYLGAGLLKKIVQGLQWLVEGVKGAWNSFEKQCPIIAKALKFAATTGIGMGLLALASSQAIMAGMATGTLAGVALSLGGLTVSMVAGYTGAQLFEYVRQHGQGMIDKSKKFIAEKLQFFDSELTQEEANWAAGHFVDFSVNVLGLVAQHKLSKATLNLYNRRILTPGLNKIAKQRAKKITNSTQHQSQNGQTKQDNNPLKTEQRLTSPCSQSLEKGETSFHRYKTRYGKAGQGHALHHIVEQNPTNMQQFDARIIHHPDNIVEIPHGKNSLHSKISGHYSTKPEKLKGLRRVRDWISQKSYEEQYAYGLKILEEFGWKNLKP